MIETWSRVMSNVVPGMASWAVSRPAPQALDEHGLVREDRQFVAVDHVEPEELGSRKHGGPAEGTTTRVDGLDVALGPGQLRVDLLIDQLPHDVGGWS